MSTIDVIIPLFNCEKYIIDAIRSVQKQTIYINKIIVIDDGSTDNGPYLVDQLRQHDNRIYLMRGKNQGPSAARNMGIKISDAEFIAFLDSDDIWAQDKIRLQLDMMLPIPNLVFVHTLAQAIDSQGNCLGLIPLNHKGGVSPRINTQATFDTIRSGSSIIYGSASSVLARRSFLITAGLFDVTLRDAEDWDLWARLAELGPVGVIDRPLVSIRINEKSAQRSVSAEIRAKKRLQGRINVATHWENDPEFMWQHRQLARSDAWNIIRWLLFKPSSLIIFYKELRHHKLKAGHIIITGVLDYLSLIGWGIAKSIRDALTSPKEIQRLWQRFMAERKK